MVSSLTTDRSTASVKVSFVPESDNAVYALQKSQHGYYEKELLWYTRHDYRSFRNRDFLLKQILKQIGPAEVEKRKDEESTRGLLTFRNEESIRHRIKCSAIVLSSGRKSTLQDLKRFFPELMYLVEESIDELSGDEHYHEGDIIAQLYGLASLANVQKAIERGTADRRWVEEYILQRQDHETDQPVAEKDNGTVPAQSIPMLSGWLPQQDMSDSSVTISTNHHTPPSSESSSSSSFSPVISFYQIHSMLFCTSYAAMAVENLRIYVHRIIEWPVSNTNHFQKT